MSAEQKDCKVEIGFGEWFGLVCKHDPLAYPQLLCMILLMFGASFLATMHNAVVGYLLFFGLGSAFMWALHRAWHRSLENPPWYLKEWGTGYAGTDND